MEAILAILEAILSPSWVGRSGLGGHLARLGGLLDRLGAFLGRFGDLVGRLGAIVWPSWGPLGPSWGGLGSLVGFLGDDNDGNDACSHRYPQSFDRFAIGVRLAGTALKQCEAALTRRGGLYRNTFAKHSTLCFFRV